MIYTKLSYRSRLQCLSEPYDAKVRKIEHINQGKSKKIGKLFIKKLINNKKCFPVVLKGLREACHTEQGTSEPGKTIGGGFYGIGCAEKSFKNEF